MKTTTLTPPLAGLCILAVLMTTAAAQASDQVQPLAQRPALEISSQAVRYMPQLELLVFEIGLKGRPETAEPEAAGQLDGAPVVGYVFPTSLPPEAVGFGDQEGILALAATSHPDFDDTPLWDEGVTGAYDDDGAVWHAHWVVLGEDERVPGGLSVIEFGAQDKPILPPTNPGMQILLDSPGFAIVTQKKKLRILVPAYRVSNQTDFQFDAVTAYMEVNTSDENRPMLGVYKVYDVASGDLSLPYNVTGKKGSKSR